MKNLFDALVLGIVEGLTEFLPVSSTGHLILAGDLLEFDHPSRDVFYLAIQTGAMLAVLWEYRARFFRVDLQLWRNLIVAFIPAAVLGLLAGNFIKSYLFKPVPVALAFIIGGIIILLVDRGQRISRVETTQAMTALDALKVGFAQCFALIPGTSRSGATIIGGMLFGLSRKAATEFSFFLAVPTLIAAGAYDSWKNRQLFSVERRRHVGGRPCGVLRLGVPGDPLAHPLRRDARLSLVRVVPHRLRNRGAANRVFRLGVLDR